MPARRKPAAADAAPIQPIPAEEAGPPVASAIDVEPATEAAQRPPYRDVREQKTVAISPGPDGDKLRLLRSDRYNQMQVRPDGELPDWARERLKAEGWRDRVEDEGIYTRQLPPRPRAGEDDRELSSARRRAVFEAERFFEELANDIRADRKMPPVRLGMAAER